MNKKFVSERFANIRSAHNISARKLSLELGQSSEYINQIENGRKMPSLEGLFNFCEYFRISLKDFFDDGYQYPIQYREILKEFNKLTPQELDHIIQTIRYIADKK